MLFRSTRSCREEYYCKQRQYRHCCSLNLNHCSSLRSHFLGGMKTRLNWHFGLKFSQPLNTFYCTKVSQTNHAIFKLQCNLSTCSSASKLPEICTRDPILPKLRLNTARTCHVNDGSDMGYSSLVPGHRFICVRSISR